MSRARATGERLEFQRQNLWVGLFVLTAGAVFAAAALFALQERLFRREYRLNTSFARIEGLRTGAEVFLRGYAVGRVTRIDLATMPDVRFDVEFTVEEQVRLPAGTRVRLSTRGFGNKVLDVVTPGDPTDPAAPPAPAADRPAVLLEPGATVPGSAGTDLDALLSDVVVLTRRVSSAVQRMDTLLADNLGPRIESTLEAVRADLDALVADTRGTMEDARKALGQVDAALAESRPKASRLLDLATEDLKAAGDLAQRADRVLGLFETRIDPLVGDLASSLGKADALLTRADAAVEEDDVRAILENLRTLSEQGNLLVEELRRRPWRLLRRVKGEKKALVEELEERRRAEQAAGPTP